MKVSVVIPVYNVERYLARCLDSVFAAVEASQAEAEIICVNDGSTDGSAALLERYRSSFSVPHASFSVLTKPNGGLGSARNAALDVVTGDYILFVDSDDWIPLRSIATFVSVAEASQAALAVSTSFLKDDGYADFRPDIPHSPPRWTMRPTAWIAGKKVQYCAWNKLYRADLFKTRRYPATIYEDFPVTTDILREVGEFAAVDEPLYVYCLNAGATSLVRSKFTERKMRDSIEVVRRTLDAAKAKPREAFSVRQAADGLSSTVGQVYKSGDAAITAAFLQGLADLLQAYPKIAKGLTMKARWRLWLLRQQGKAVAS